MKYNRKTKLLSFLLCMCMIVPMITPILPVFSEGSSSDTSNRYSYSLNIDKTAQFNLLSPYAFIFAEDPEDFSLDYNDFFFDINNENNWLDHDDGSALGSEPHYEFDKNLVWIITNYYCNPTTGDLWYQVKPAPGFDWPQKMANLKEAWIYQNNIKNYKDGEIAREPDENVTADLYADNLIFGESKSFITDSEGAPVSSVSVSPAKKVTLTAASSLQGSVKYQWQLKYGEDKDGNDLFVDIYGENKDTIKVSYAMVHNLLDENGTVLLRLKSYTITSTAYEIIPVSIASASAVSYALRAYSDTPATVDETDDPNITEQVTLTINFIQKSNKEAVSTPKIYTVTKGTTINDTFTLPEKQGYDAYLTEDGTGAVYTSYTVNEALTENKTIIFYYIGKEIDIKVKFYLQNVADDKYKEQAEPAIIKGRVGETISDSEIAELIEEYAKLHPGFVEEAYSDHKGIEIAADGSTEVGIYFDREYYKIIFELDGGYGVQPIYARYETPITVGAPKKAGYIHQGWSEKENGELISLPTTVPAYDQKFYAVWEITDNAKVTVVFWGENADDEKYSYLSENTKEIYLKPGSEFTYSESGMLTCGKGTHTHTVDCYEFTCDKEVHEHNSDCYTCGSAEHKHAVGCYEGASAEIPDGASVPWDAPSNPKNGQVLEETHIFVRKKYIYIYGNWYTYSGSVSSGSTVSPNCGMTEHTHTTACIGCGKTEHIHTSKNCYELTCKEEEHTHTASCYQQGAGLDSSLWKFVKSDTITVAADGSSVVNVYYDRVEYSVQFYNNQSCSTSGGGGYGGSSNKEYTDLKITAKWGENILKKWPTYNGSSSWYVKDKSKTWQNSIQVMPVGGAKFWGPKSGNSKYTATYYVEVLDGESCDVKGSDGRYYKVHHTDTSNSSGKVTDEERYDIDGYTINNSISTSNGSSFDGSKFYYTRNSYKLTFNDQYSDIKSESVEFEASLSTYKDYVPDVPSQYEPGSVAFEGWYQNPQCTGKKYDFDNEKMPSHDIILYAKWVPVNHTVRFYLEEKNIVRDSNGKATDENIYKVGEKEYKYIVTHGGLIQDSNTPPNDPEKGLYKFEGWFYKDSSGNEYMWDFENTDVRSDVEIYAKWSSNVTIEYTIKYVTKVGDQEVEIAAPTKGFKKAGSDPLKVFPKGGDDLYEGYREGYFPDPLDHSITFDLDNTSERVFTFYYTPGENATYDVYYVTKDYEAGVTSEDKTYTIDGVKYYIIADTEHRDIPKCVETENYKPVKNYIPDKFQEVVYLEPGVNKDVVFIYTKSETQGTYTVEHWTQNADGNGFTLYKTEYGIADYGANITPNPIEIKNFTYVPGYKNGEYEEKASGQLIKDQDLTLKFYYTRDKYNYKVVYLEEGTNVPLHAPSIFKEGYYFESTVTADAIDINGYIVVGESTKTLVIKQDLDDPQTNIIYFYYKKSLTSLTIKKEGWNSLDVNQTFIFNIKGNDGVNIDITVHGNGSTTIYGLTVGNTYTITEKTDWSWRYDYSSCTGDANATKVDGSDLSNGAQFTINVDGTVTFTNTRSVDKWLDGDSWCNNIFTKN